MIQYLLYCVHSDDFSVCFFSLLRFDSDPENIALIEAFEARIKFLLEYRVCKRCAEFGSPIRKSPFTLLKIRRDNGDKCLSCIGQSVFGRNSSTFKSRYSRR